MIWPFTRRRIPDALVHVLQAEEQILAIAEVSGGGSLAVTRFGVWVMAVADTPIQLEWPLISKVRWKSPNLELTVADVAGELGGAQLLVDRTPVMFEIGQPGKLTDLIHSRIRSGIVSSVHSELPGGAGWIVLRRVPGHNGVTPQVRLDPGTEVGHPLLEEAVAGLAGELIAQHVSIQ